MELECKYYKSQDEGSICIHYIEYQDANVCGFCKLSHEFCCVLDLKYKMPVTTQSGLKSYAQCKWKYKVHYIDGWRLKKSRLPDAMKGGILWDAFIESKVEG